MIQRYYANISPYNSKNNIYIYIYDMNITNYQSYTTKIYPFELIYFQVRYKVTNIINKYNFTRKQNLPMDMQPQ